MLFPGLYIVLLNKVIWKGNKLPDIIGLLLGHKVHCVFQKYYHYLSNKSLPLIPLLFEKIQKGKINNNLANNLWWPLWFLFPQRSQLISVEQQHKFIIAELAESFYLFCFIYVWTPWSWKCNWKSIMLLGNFPGFNAGVLQLQQEDTCSRRVTGRASEETEKRPGSWNSCTDKTSPTQNLIK